MSLNSRSKTFPGCLCDVVSLLPAGFGKPQIFQFGQCPLEERPAISLAHVDLTRHKEVSTLFWARFRRQGPRQWH